MTWEEHERMVEEGHGMHECASDCPLPPADAPRPSVAWHLVALVIVIAFFAFALAITGAAS